MGRVLFVFCMTPLRSCEFLVVFNNPPLEAWCCFVFAEGVCSLQCSQEQMLFARKMQIGRIMFFMFWTNKQEDVRLRHFWKHFLCQLGFGPIMCSSG